jgi:hypothetical protein
MQISTESSGEGATVMKWCVEEEQEIQRYIRGYQQQPETEEELGWADRVTVEALSEQPWE